MTHYADNPGMVRVDYFKDSGKWYMTEAHDMSEFYNEPSIHDAVRKTLERDGRWLPHFTIVVLKPYHQHAHPVSFTSEEIKAALRATGEAGTPDPMHDRRGTLYLAPNGDVYKHDEVSPEWMATPSTPQHVNFKVMLASGGFSNRTELPEGSRVIWRPTS